MKTELCIVAFTWAIAAGIGQLLLWPFGAANFALWFGLVIGSTCQSAIYFFREDKPFG